MNTTKETEICYTLYTNKVYIYIYLYKLLNELKEKWNGRGPSKYTRNI